MSALVELDISNSSATEPIFVLPEVLAQQQEANQTRRWFHAHPELSMVEFITAAKIAEHLRAIGIEEVIEKVGQTGVVGLIRGSKPGPCIGLRADIDGLPITETAAIDYKSKHDGVMHACGHDGHITELLVAAKILWAERHNLSGVVKLIFQPGEEGAGGARYMIEDGVLEEGSTGPRVEEIYGIHIWSCKFIYIFCPFYFCLF
jgi:amidohydrolase